MDADNNTESTDLNITNRRTQQSLPTECNTNKRRIDIMALTCFSMAKSSQHRKVVAETTNGSQDVESRGISLISLKE